MDVAIFTGPITITDRWVYSLHHRSVTVLSNSMILALTITLTLTQTLVLNLFFFHQSVIGERNHFMYIPWDGTRSFRGAVTKWPWSKPDTCTNFVPDNYRIFPMRYAGTIRKAKEMLFTMHKLQYQQWNCIFALIMPPPRGHNAVIGVRRPSVWCRVHRL